MVEPRGIEPLTFAMPLPENLLQSLFSHAFLERYQPERDKNIAILRYRCDTSLSVAEHAVTRPCAPTAIAWISYKMRVLVDWYLARLATFEHVNLARAAEHR